MPRLEEPAGSYHRAVPATVRRMLQIAAVLLLAVLVALFAKSLIDNQTSVAALVADGKEPAAPDFTLSKLDGSGQASLSDYRGKVVILNFWASWCDPCKDEAPLLQELSREYAHRNVVVLGVDSQDTTGDAKAFAGRYGLDYPLVHASGSSLYDRWGLSGFPETFLIAANGKVVHHFPGPVDGTDVKAILDPMLTTGRA
jgi:cytochrome c biogenesis protein CcmG, thiol:disulfide interchange protein DsbE